MAGAERTSPWMDGSSPDEQAGDVAHLVVPHLADWCNVYVVGEDGEPHRLAAAHRDPEKDELIRALLRFPVAASPDHPVRRAIRTREPVLAPAPDAEATAVRYATDDEHARLIRELGTGPALVVPLVARGESVGALSAGRIGTAGVGPSAGVESARLLEVARRAALALDNARLYREAQDALRLRDQVLATVSHDLRTPLAAIYGQAQLLAREAARDCTPEAPRRARRAVAIMDGARRMTAMVDELLDVARLQAGQHLELQRETVDLLALARRVAAEQRRHAPSHSIVVDAEAERVEGEWDAPRIERVLANVVGNAVKYSPLSGEVRVSVAVDADAAVVTVRDSGIGIAPEDLGRIFEPFQRGRLAHGQIAGQGLGLASARQIVESHDGRICAQSTLGSGSTFTIRLPLSPPADSGSANSARAEAASR